MTQEEGPPERAHPRAGPSPSWAAAVPADLPTGPSPERGSRILTTFLKPASPGHLSSASSSPGETEASKHGPPLAVAPTLPAGQESLVPSAEGGPLHCPLGPRPSSFLSDFPPSSHASLLQPCIWVSGALSRQVSSLKPPHPRDDPKKSPQTLFRTTCHTTTRFCAVWSPSCRHQAYKCVILWFR